MFLISARIDKKSVSTLLLIIRAVRVGTRSLIVFGDLLIAKDDDASNQKTRLLRNICKSTWKL